MLVHDCAERRRGVHLRFAVRSHPAPGGRVGGLASSLDVTGPLPSPPASAAFFDLDKTIIAGSSALAFSRPFRRQGLLTRRAVLRSGVRAVV